MEGDVTGVFDFFEHKEIKKLIKDAYKLRSHLTSIGVHATINPEVKKYSWKANTHRITGVPVRRLELRNTNIDAIEYANHTRISHGSSTTGGGTEEYHIKVKYLVEGHLRVKGKDLEACTKIIKKDSSFLGLFGTPVKVMWAGGIFHRNPRVAETLNSDASLKTALYNELIRKRYGIAKAIVRLFEPNIIESDIDNKDIKRIEGIELRQGIDLEERYKRGLKYYHKNVVEIDPRSVPCPVFGRLPVVSVLPSAETFGIYDGIAKHIKEGFMK
ncbi:MAG: hypothetical protein HXS46_06810 [Theionarchaea archaeon]|nr:hypothetical protein [Theionarchaea archaeon]